MKKFHINQLPQDRIFVLLNKRVHNKLFKDLSKGHSFKELNKLINNKLNYSTYKKWKSRVKNKNGYSRFIPLWFFTKISRIFSNFNINHIESNILAYKGPSASTIILKPKFPIKEDERILRLVAHLIGDGHADGAFGTNLPKGKSSSHYANTNLNVIKSFQKDLKFFGSFKTNIKMAKVNEHKIYKIGIPNLVGYILTHIYNVNFDCFNSRVPKVVYKLNKNQVASFIRAFADDEAHVYDSSIEFYSSNKFLIEDFIKLIKLKFPKVNLSKLKINKKSGENTKNPKYSFSILSQSLDFYAKNMGFDHKQKMEDLLFNIRRMKLNKGYMWKGDIETKIINSLSKENLTAKQLSRKFYLRHSWVLKSLNKILKEGKVEIVDKNKFSNVWGLKTSSY